MHVGKLICLLCWAGFEGSLQLADHYISEYTFVYCKKIGLRKLIISKRALKTQQTFALLQRYRKKECIAGWLDKYGSDQLCQAMQQRTEGLEPVLRIRLPGKAAQVLKKAFFVVQDFRFINDEVYQFARTDTGFAVMISSKATDYMPGSMFQLI